MFNINIWPNSAPLEDITCIRLRNLSDLEFDLSRLLKVKCDDVIELAIYGFRLIYSVITFQLSPLSSHIRSKCFLPSVIIRPKLQKNRKCPE